MRSVRWHQGRERQRGDLAGLPVVSPPIRFAGSHAGVAGYGVKPRTPTGSVLLAVANVDEYDYLIGIKAGGRGQPAPRPAATTFRFKAGDAGYPGVRCGDVDCGDHAGGGLGLHVGVGPWSGYGPWQSHPARPRTPITAYIMAPTVDMSWAVWE